MIREVVFLVPDGPGVERPDDEHPRDAGEEIPARSLQVIHQCFEDGEAEQIRPFAAKEIDHKALLTDFMTAVAEGVYIRLFQLKSPTGFRWGFLQTTHS